MALPAIRSSLRPQLALHADHRAGGLTDDRIGIRAKAAEDSGRGVTANNQQLGIGLRCHYGNGGCNLAALDPDGGFLRVPVRAIPRSVV